MKNTIRNEEKQSSLIWFFGVSFFFFVVYFLLNKKTALLNDDYTYRLVFEYWRVSDNPVKVSSLNDIYTGMVNHYLLWGGRIPVHATVQLLLWLVDKKIFDIINAFMAVLLGFLTYFHANFGRKRSPVVLVVVFTMLWFFIPQPEVALVTPTNSVNNMWTCVYVLMFLIPYRILLTSSTPAKHNFLLSVVLVPVGFLAGWSSEPSGAAAGAMAVLTIVCLLKDKKNPPAWAYIGTTALAAGWSLMAFAPGYRYKAAHYYEVDNVLKSALKNHWEIWSNLLKTTFRFVWPVLLLLILFFAVLYKMRKNNFAGSRIKASIIRKKILVGSDHIPEVLYSASACISVAIYVIAPEFVPRYLFPAIVFLVIATVIVFSRIINEVSLKEKRFRLVMNIIISACFAAAVADAVYECNIVFYNYTLTSAIENDIRTQVSQGKENVVIQGNYCFLSAGRFSIYKYDFVGMEILWGGLDPKYEINRLYAANFGAKTYINESTMLFVDSKQ